MYVKKPMVLTSMRSFFNRETKDITHTLEVKRPTIKAKPGAVLDIDNTYEFN